ncbi:MAG TPA: DUF1566 domain-containing protein [Oligoflexus sp.]|uniref:Lcl C-terminal domain-containing protein n=1 Tax=Oligoflexus sp. TaxID=1971216 RepID=UPI002D80CA05|nr:DUF1566 domain-containing protein [Oligoflexus sp.]HET9236777.1 DUF1566 domain-containing protein [Oligoflexus sp.]
MLTLSCGKGSGVKRETVVKAEAKDATVYVPGAQVAVTQPKDKAVYKNQGGEVAPLMMLEASRVCDDMMFYNGEGELVQGTRACSGGAGLKPENIRSGVTIGDITGTLVDIQDEIELKAENLRMAVTIGSVIGAFVASPDDCASEGSTSCVANAQYKPALTTGLASKVLASQSIAGVSGNIVLPLAGKVLSGTSYGINSTSMAGTLALPAAASVLSGTGSYGDPASPTTPAYVPDFPSPANVRSLDSSNNASGTLLDCSSDGATGCVTSNLFKAANKALATAGNIRSGVTLAAESGDYPSSTYTLPSASATADLDSVTFNAKVKASATFEYWSSDGTHHSNAGDTGIAAENIRSGVTIFGTTGTLPAPSCSYSTQGSCTADNTCRWTGSACEINPWNLRNTVTIYAKTGTIKNNCRNRVNSSAYNSDLSPPGNGAITSGSAIDWWDTIGNVFNNAFPTLQPTGWSTENACGKELWSDLTPDGACDSAADDCMMQDNVTGLIWSESSPVGGGAASNTTKDWSLAVEHCASLTFGSRSDWRLPTQMEMQNAYNHGISQLAYKQGGTTARPGGDTLDNNNFFMATVGSYWSATTKSSDTTYAYNLHMNQSYSNDVLKTATHIPICVAP